MAEAGEERSLPSDLTQGVAHEHWQIREASLRLESVRGLGDLLKRLAEFRSLLVHHFNGEEAPDGFYDMIRSMAPGHLGRIDQVEKEHRALVAEIDQVTARARACFEGPVAEILRQAAELARRVRLHEARENELLMDAVYTDLGQGD